MIATRRSGGRIDGTGAKTISWGGIASLHGSSPAAGSVEKKLSIRSGFAERTILRVLAHANFVGCSGATGVPGH